VNSLLWWGYLHINETVQCKRYFDNGDIDEAIESSFVIQVYGPFEAKSRAEALKILNKRFGTG
jgi:hypothetical protein